MFQGAASAGTKLLALRSALFPHAELLAACKSLYPSALSPSPVITVVIPTKDRPQMLRTALRSIAQQSARDKIERVILAETIPGSDSQMLCKEFASLPIEYVVRDRLLKPLEHTELLFREAAEAGSQFTALLHDDDWWGPAHLEIGLAQLLANADASTYWTAAFMVHGERSWVYQCWNVSSWIAAEYPRSTQS